VDAATEAGATEEAAIAVSLLATCRVGYDELKIGGCDVSEPKTVKVQIAVVLDDHGNWSANGDSEYTQTTMLREAERFLSETRSDGIRRFYWLEADLPLPTAESVAAKVVEAE